MSYFDNDEWRSADWMNALDRLASAIEASSNPLSPASRDGSASMKPKKPCANCGIVPEVNQAFGRDWWIECKNPHCKNQAHQLTYYPTPEQSIAAWDAPRWYEPQPADEVPLSGKLLDAATKTETLPLEGQILVWVDGLNEWRTACMCIAYDDPDFPLPLEQRRYYMVDGDHEERGYNLTPELIWMPLPPAPEGYHAE